MHSGPGGIPQPLGAQNMAMALGALPNMQYMGKIIDSIMEWKGTTGTMW